MSEDFSSISYLRERLNSDQNNQLREIEQWLINCLKYKISKYKCPGKFDEQLTELLRKIIAEVNPPNNLYEHNYSIPFGYFLEMLLDKNLHKYFIEADDDAVSNKDVQSAFDEVMEMRTKPGRLPLYSDCVLNEKQESNMNEIEEYFSNHKPLFNVLKKTIEAQIDSDKVGTILAVKNLLTNFVNYQEKNKGKSKTKKHCKEENFEQYRDKKIKSNKDLKKENFCKELDFLLNKDSLRRKENILDSLEAYVEIYRKKFLDELTKLKNTTQLKDKCAYLGWPENAAESYPCCYKMASQVFPQLAESYSGNISKKTNSIDEIEDTLSKTYLTFPNGFNSLVSTDFFANAVSAINCLFKICKEDEDNHYVPPGLLYDCQIQKNKIYEIAQVYTEAIEHIGKYAAEIKEGISPETRPNDEYVYFHKEEGIALFYKQDTNGSEKLVNIAWNTPSKLISKCLEELVSDADSPERIVGSFIKMLNLCDSYVGGTPVASKKIGNYDELKKSCLETIQNQKISISMISAGSVVHHVLKHHLSNFTDPETGKQFSLLEFTDKEVKLLIEDYFEKVKRSAEKLAVENVSGNKFTLNGKIHIQFEKTPLEEMNVFSLLAYTVTPNLELILKTAYTPTFPPSNNYSIQLLI